MPASKRNDAPADGGPGSATSPSSQHLSQQNERSPFVVADSSPWPNLLESLGLDRPIWQDHSPLLLGWSDAQLLGVAEAIGPRLTTHLTDNVVMTAASIARTVVTEHLTRDRGTYYSRARDFYRPSRYRNDERFSYFYVTRGADALRQAGLVEHAMGFWVQGNKGRRLVMWPTATLVELVAPLINCDELRERRCGETIILRDCCAALSMTMMASPALTMVR